MHSCGMSSEKAMKINDRHTIQNNKQFVHSENQRKSMKINETHESYSYENQNLSKHVKSYQNINSCGMISEKL